MLAVLLLRVGGGYKAAEGRKQRKNHLTELKGLLPPSHTPLLVTLLLQQHCAALFTQPSAATAAAAGAGRQQQQQQGLAAKAGFSAAAQEAGGCCDGSYLQCICWFDIDTFRIQWLIMNSCVRLHIVLAATLSIKPTSTWCGVIAHQVIS
jgi:hypothetical protein